MTSARQIIDATCAIYDLRKDDLLGSCRRAEYAHPRQNAMLVIRALTDLSLTNIGWRMDRDHSTVSHGIRAAAKRWRECSDTREDIIEIARRVA